MNKNKEIRYFKNIDKEYITNISTNFGKIEISETEYLTILDMVQNRPSQPKGYLAMLKTDLTWKLVELSPDPSDFGDDLSDTEALDIILGGADA